MKKKPSCKSKHKIEILHLNFFRLKKGGINWPVMDTTLFEKYPSMQLLISLKVNMLACEIKGFSKQVFTTRNKIRALQMQ